MKDRSRMGESSRRALDRRAFLARLWLRGATIAAIAVRWHTSNQTVIEALRAAVPEGERRAEIGRRRARAARAGGRARGRQVIAGQVKRRPNGRGDAGQFMPRAQPCVAAQPRSREAA